MRLFTILILISMVSCVCSKNNTTQDTVDFKPVYKPGPSIHIYKTKNNYNQFVPIFLNKEKSQVIAYPHPKDLKRNDDLTLPTELKDGYLLDNRGIDLNVAFIKITYKEYSKLDEVPNPEELMKMIIDSDPIIEFYDCGLKTAFNNEVEQLNKIIEEKKLDKIFKKIK